MSSGSWEQELKALREAVARLEKRHDGLAPRAVRYERAAQLLSVSPSTLKTMVRRGILVPVKILGRKMIPVSEIDRVATPKLPRRIAETAPKSKHDGAAQAAAYRATLRKRS